MREERLTQARQIRLPLAASVVGVLGVGPMATAVAIVVTGSTSAANVVLWLVVQPRLLPAGEEALKLPIAVPHQEGGTPAWEFHPGR
jgi:hypothetical protein